MCSFQFCFADSVGHVDSSVGCGDNSVGRVCGIGSGVFSPIGIK